MRGSGRLVTRTGMNALAAGELLSACGGGDDTPTTTTTSSTSTTTTTAAPVTTTLAPAVTTTVAAVTTCQIEQISATLSASDAGAGQRYANLAFTNNSAKACTMFGYIGMQLLTNNGNAFLPTDIVRNENVTKAEITLVPNGGQAYTTLHWSVVGGVGEPQDVQCQPTPDKVQITPPNEDDFLVQPWTLGFVCQMGKIDVNPVRAGAGP